ncbi:S-formylglutathione hydrolase [Alteromonas oceanisediminis]|uniref:S-formylglutathione hydrolase n=1 Tax=Alteromonas oceanisediminis TaxID=2836180 RepID=UPI001BDA560D|nr:S-formylglutathione hydrolase [Alteromonas oceanisediminis]MBT0585868.1 S-formylglutathione hydrolase [Alteromonas oceanisediminis]
MDIISRQRVFEGELIRFKHDAASTHCEMTCSVFMPPQASADTPVPTLYWLSGLTCNDQNFAQKAGAFRAAVDMNIAIVMPDTSPRGDNVPDDDEGSYDFGLGAGFYVDATRPPFNQHYRMYSYIVDELPALIEHSFDVTSVKSISGHSMGGHGALIIGLKNPQHYRAMSSFSPVCHPSDCPWGKKAFALYLGDDAGAWEAYDATLLIAKAQSVRPIKIDQGSADEFLAEQLKPDALLKAAHQQDVSLQYGLHTGYDHSYYFISSFIDDHIAFHAEHLHDR